jgi:hypothetical protein
MDFRLGLNHYLKLLTFMRPKKLIFYTPGFISLMILFPLLMHLLIESGGFKNYKIIESKWIDPRDTLAQQWPTAALAKRNWSRVDLTGDYRIDQSRIEQVIDAVNNMIRKHDTINGVLVHFTDRAKYQSLVELINIADRYMITGYSGIENDYCLFLRGRFEEPRREYFFCGDPSYHLPLPSQASIFDFPLQYTFNKRLWPVWVMLGLLGLLAVRTIRSASF